MPRGTVADVTAAMRAMVGMTEVPPGSNICEITRELDAVYPPVPLAGGGTSWRSGQSWCASGILGAMRRAGYPRLDPTGAIRLTTGQLVRMFYTPADVNVWRSAGRWLPWNLTPPVGALAYYDWEGTRGTTSLTDHVGYVDEVRATAVCTVECNTSPAGLVSNGGGVFTFGPGRQAPARPLATIVGYGLPEYAPETTPPPNPGDPNVADFALVRFAHSPGDIFRTIKTPPFVLWVEPIGLPLFQSYARILGQSDTSVDWVEVLEAEAVGNISCFGLTPDQSRVPTSRWPFMAVYPPNGIGTHTHADLAPSSHSHPAQPPATHTHPELAPAGHAHTSVPTHSHPAQPPAPHSHPLTGNTGQSA